MGRRHGVALDVDGTLVDSTFHHAVCWHRAFAQHDVAVPAHVAHRHVGMGGDHLVAAVAGEDVEARHGDAIRAAHDALFAVELPTIRPLPGARAFLRALAEHRADVVLLSSASGPEIEHYVDLLGARDLLVGWTTSDDVDRTKPDPDLVHPALALLRSDHLVVVGDSPWDVEAARRAGMPAVGVDTGGFGRAVLEDAGAVLVADDLEDLRHRVNEEPFVAWRAARPVPA